MNRHNIAAALCNVTQTSKCGKVPLVHWTLSFLYLKLTEKKKWRMHPVPSQVAEDRNIGSQWCDIHFLGKGPPLSYLAFLRIGNSVPPTATTNKTTEVVRIYDSRKKISTSINSRHPQVWVSDMVLSLYGRGEGVPHMGSKNWVPFDPLTYSSLFRFIGNYLTLWPLGLISDLCPFLF